MNEPIDPYEDIIHLPAHRSLKRQPMPRADRAAQFSAFAALTGHGAAIRETARLTESRPELSEVAKAEIDAALHLLRRHSGGEARLSWFEPDKLKSGGACRTATIGIRRLDTARRCLLLEDGRRIPLDDILSLELL